MADANGSYSASAFTYNGKAFYPHDSGGFGIGWSQYGTGWTVDAYAGGDPASGFYEMGANLGGDSSSPLTSAGAYTAFWPYGTPVVTAAGATISGRLVDGDGNGVAGVDVTGSASGKSDVTDTSVAYQTSVDRAPHNMTANNSPSPYVASASSNNGSGHEPFGAFDGGAGDWMSGADGGAGWLKIDLGSAQEVGGYGFTSNQNYAPKNWTFEGSNNNTDWTTLDTRTNQTSWSGRNDYACTTPGTFRYYRLVVTVTNGYNSWIIVTEFYLWGGSGNYALESLADATWTVTPDDTDYTWDPTSQQVVVSGADETGIDFEVDAGGQGYSSGAAAAQGTAASGTGAMAGQYESGAAAQQGSAAQATGLLDLGTSAVAAQGSAASASGETVRYYPLYTTPPRRGPAWRTAVQAADLNRVTCAVRHDGAYWVGAVGSPALYRVADGVAVPVAIPEGDLIVAVTGLASDGTSLYVASMYRSGSAQAVGGVAPVPYSGRLDIWNGSAWSTNWDPAAYALGTGEVDSADEILWTEGLLWGSQIRQWARGRWQSAGLTAMTRRTRPAGGGVLWEGYTHGYLRRSPVTSFALPANMTPNTLCWWQGRPWCLRFIGDQQVLCYGDAATGTWQDVARWPADTGGCYWFMRGWRGTLVMYGATATLTEVADSVWQVDLAPVRAVFSPPQLALAQAETEFTQSCTEDDDPALALRAATAPRLVVLFPPLETAYEGEVLYIDPAWSPGAGVVTRAAALQALTAELRTWGGAGWAYAESTPLLQITSVALERRKTCLYCVELEYGDGSGDHKALLRAAELEYSRRRGRALLRAVELEYADGSGTHKALLRAAEVAFSDGTGDHRALLRAAELEYAGRGHTALLRAAELEYGTAPTGPAAGESVLVLLPYTPSMAPVNAVRVVVPLEALPRIRCCLVRVDTGQAADAWPTYEAFAPMENYTLRETGDAYRFALIGNGEVPEVLIVLNPD